jgi:hypothetical protein
MLIGTQVIRSKSELLKEIQRMPIAKAVVYRSADRTAWEQSAREHLG